MTEVYASAAPPRKMLARHRTCSTIRLSHLRHSTRQTCATRLLACPLPHRIDVEILPWMLPVGVLLVALHPRLHKRVLDGVNAEPPRVVRGDELRHPAIDLVALRTVGQTPRRAIQVVVLRQREARVVGLLDVLAVQQLRECVAL